MSDTSELGIKSDGWLCHGFGMQRLHDLFLPSPCEKEGKKLILTKYNTHRKTELVTLHTATHLYAIRTYFFSVGWLLMKPVSSLELFLELCFMKTNKLIALCL